MLICSYAIEEMTKRENQMLIIINAFRSLSNKNGIITTKEIYHYSLESGDIDMNNNSESARLRAQKLMDMMDPDIRGEISFMDYVRANIIKYQITSWFTSDIKHKGLEMLDPNHTGKIDARLLEKRFTKSMYVRESTKLLSRISTKVDESGLIDVNAIESPAQVKAPEVTVNESSFTFDEDGNKNITEKVKEKQKDRE